MLSVLHKSQGPMSDQTCKNKTKKQAHDVTWLSFEPTVNYPPFFPVRGFWSPTDFLLVSSLGLLNVKSLQLFLAVQNRSLCCLKLHCVLPYFNVFLIVKLWFVVHTVYCTFHWHSSHYFPIAAKEPEVRSIYWKQRAYGTISISCYSHN